MMKKVMGFVAVAALAGVLAVGCGNKANETEAATNAATEVATEATTEVATEATTEEATEAATEEVAVTE